MDGVISDFDKHFVDYFKKNHKEDLTDDQMWELIHSYPTFFRDLPLMPFARGLFEALKPYNPIILTACPKANYQTVAIQKREWIREHFGDLTVLPVTGGKNKSLFMHAPGDVLIDDFYSNIKAWRKLGGKGILFQNNEQALTELQEYVDQLKLAA